MTRLYCGWDKDDKTLLWLKDATSTVIPDIIENNTRHFWKLKISYICDASYFRSSFSGPCKNFLRPCGCHPDLSRYSSINLIIPAMRNPLHWYNEWGKKKKQEEERALEGSKHLHATDWLLGSSHFTVWKGILHSEA